MGFGEHHGLESAESVGDMLVVRGGSTFETWFVTSSMILVGGSNPHEKNICQIGSFSQVGLNIKNV